MTPPADRTPTGPGRSGEPRPRTASARPGAGARGAAPVRTRAPGQRRSGPAPRTPQPAAGSRAPQAADRSARSPRPRAGDAVRHPVVTSRAPRPLRSSAPTPRRAPVVVLPPARTGSAPGRQNVMLVLVLALLTVFAGRLVHVQGLQGTVLAEEAMTQRLVTVPIPGDRGNIVDRNGDVLATSVERYNIVVNQDQFSTARPTADGALEAATELEALLGVTAAELGPRLMGDDQFVYLAKGVAPELYREVMALRLPGISGERTTDRLYPAGTTGGNIVGFVGAEGFGQAGLEQVYDEMLSGKPGEETYERGARGQRIPSGKDDLVPAVPGHDIRMTIDVDLQYVVQQALDAQVAATGAQWGVVEVVDVRTGEILTLADSGTIDPNAPTSASPSRAATYVYEPGSTAKVIAMAAILDTGLATPTTEYVVPYTYAVPNGESFKDSHEHPDLKLTLNGILAQSSNTGTVMVGQHLPRQVRHDYLAKFGFGSLTGVGLPGESRGLMHDAEDWDGRTEYAVLFGQGVGVTTLQATQVFATLANGGLRVEPHVVQGTTAPDGTFHPRETTEPVRVISEETADTLVQMLESAVADGTGGSAAVPGYRIAGKTGTSQAFEGNGVIKNVASFIGIAPADDPRLVVNVALYDPKTSIYGGVVAAPVFSEVTAHALRYLGVPPTGTQPQLIPTEYE